MPSGRRKVQSPESQDYNGTDYYDNDDMFGDGRDIKTEKGRNETNGNYSEEESPYNEKKETSADTAYRHSNDSPDAANGNHGESDESRRLNGDDNNKNDMDKKGNKKERGRIYSSSIISGLMDQYLNYEYNSGEAPPVHPKPRSQSEGTNVDELENNLKNLENDGLDLSVTRPNVRDSQEDDDENDDNENEPENQVLNIKEELELMIKVKLDDINHNLRCLHTYQHIRTSRLKEIKWQTGITKLPASLNNCLSKNEQAWYRSNIQNVHKFMSRAEIRHLDLTTDLEPPSTVNIVTVKCNEDLGQVMLSNGVSVTFERNMIYSFPKNVIEKYVRLGQLEVV